MPRMSFSKQRRQGSTQRAALDHEFRREKGTSFRPLREGARGVLPSGRARLADRLAFEAIAQRGFQHLAVAVLGQGIDDLVVPGPLEARQIVDAPGVEFCGVGLLLWVEGDESHRHLSPLRITLADNGNLGNRRMHQQHLFDLARIDVRTARDDQILRSILQGQKTIVIEHSHVAGVQPAIPQRVAGGLRIAPVAGHHRLTANHASPSWNGPSGRPSASATATSTSD